MAQVFREVKNSSRGDDCILETVQSFDERPGTRVAFVTEDRMLRIRALQMGLHAVSCQEFAAKLRMGEALGC
eukprot:gene3259-13283_t